MSQFYEIDSSRVSHVEYWWGTKSPLVLIGWILKWLRVKIPGSSDDPNVDSILPFGVDGLPEEANSVVGPVVEELTALGFENPVCHRICDYGTQTTIYWVSMIHSSGRHFARVHHRVWQKATPANRGVFPMFFTAFDDGTFLVSSSGKPDMAAPESVRMNRMHKAPTSKLWETHTALVDRDLVSRTILPVLSVEDLIAMTERHHVLVRDFHIGRGVFKTRNAVEQARADAFSASVAQAQAGGMRHADVLAELERIQTDKPSWKNAIWLLVATAIGFILAGAAQWSWKVVLWIVPVLFLHEAGHWIAMRIFQYRNLRMFFIPFFGAAVTGQNWNVAGWKKSLVSLAGPVPGVCLGVIVGSIGMAGRFDALMQAGLMLLLINGFNLLPFLPLDGGHVCHATLFCRNRWLDIIFRSLAVVCMVLMGMFGFGKMLMYLAIPLAMGLPLAFKLGKITDNLRRSPMPPPVPGHDAIDPGAAQTIISAIKAELPAKNVSTKTLAQQTLSIYETLNARPPGIFATFGILAIHGGALLLALAFTVALVIGKQGSFGNFLNLAARQPTHKASCGSVEISRGKACQSGGGKVSSIVSTLKDRAAATKAFGEFKSRIPDTATMTLIGDSLVLTLPAGDKAGRETWFDELIARSTNTFVALTNQSVGVSLVFVAPDEVVATNIVRDIEGYFFAPNCAVLIAPWAPEALGAEFEKYRQARRAWRQFNVAYGEIWQDQRLASFGVRVSKAIKRGSTDEVDRISKEQEELIKKLRNEVKDKLIAELSNGDNADLINLHFRFSEAITNKVERDELTRKIGLKLGMTSSPAKGLFAPPAAFNALYGSVSSHGQMVKIDWMQVSRPDVCLPALIDWLCEKKCISIKYEFDDSAINCNLDGTRE